MSLEDRSVLSHRPDRPKQTDEFSAEWGEDTHIWKARQQYGELLNKAIQPSTVPGIVGGTRKNPRKTVQFEQGQERRMEEFARIFEAAYSAHREEIPMEWFLQHDPRDLSFLGEGSEDLVDYVRSAQAEANVLARDEEIAYASLERRADETVKTRARIRNALGLIPGVGGLIQDITLNPDTDAQREQVLAELQAEWHQKLTTSPEAEDELMRDAIDFFIVRPLSSILDLSMLLIQGAADLGESNLRRSGSASPPLAVLGATQMYLRSKSELALAEERASMGMDTISAVDLKRMARGAAVEEFERMEEEEPEALSQFFTAAGGDRMMAMGLFSAELQGQLPSPDEQTAQLQPERETDMMLQMEDSDYRITNDLLNGLAVYGDRVMQLATSYALLLTDEDMQSSALRGEFTKLWTEAERYNNSPAEVFGIGGSALGLMLDLFAGVVSDPTVWFLGPKGIGTLRVATKAAAARLAKAPLTKRMVQDVAAASAKNDLSAIAVHTAWMDDIGALDKLIHITKKADTSIGSEVLAPGVNVPTSRTLRAAADDFTPWHKKAYDGDPPDLSPEFNQPNRTWVPTQDKRGSAGPGVIETQTVNGVRLRFARQEYPGEPTRFAWITDDGIAVAGLRHDMTGSSAAWWVAPSFRGKDNQLTTKLIDAMRKTDIEGAGDAGVADLLRTSLNDPSLSKDGARALEREVKRFVNDMDASQGRIRAVMDAVDVEAAQAAVEQAILNGALPPDAFRIVRPTLAAETARQALNNMPPAEWFARYSGQFNKTTFLAGHGPAHWGDIVESVVGVWSLDKDGSNFWIGELYAARQTKSQLKRARLEDGLQARAMALSDEIATLMDEVGGGLQSLSDDALRGADELIPPAGPVGKTLDELNPQEIAELDNIGNAARAGDELPPSIADEMNNITTTDELGLNSPVVSAGDRVYAAEWAADITEARALRQEHGMISRTLIQRKMNVGHTRAERILKEIDEPLPAAGAADDVVSSAEYRALEQRVLGAEKKGNWEDWTPEQRALYDAEDYAGFSRARGYTEAEIADHQRYMELSKDLTPDQQVAYPAGSPNEGQLAQSVSNEQFLARLGDDVAEVMTKMEQMQVRLLDSQIEYANVMRTLGTKYKLVDDIADIEAIIIKSWEDFNRKHIATHKAWKGNNPHTGKPWVNPKTGMVDWDTLQGRITGQNTVGEGARQILPDSVLKANPEAESFLRAVSGTANTKMNINLPLSPLDMIIASGAGGSRYLKMIAKEGFGAKIRDGLWAAQRAWIIDKIARPATAAVVSFEELHRFFHKYGIAAEYRWGADKAIAIEARANALIRHGKLKKQSGSGYLSQAKQERLARLTEIPNAIRGAERLSMETIGQGYMNIAPHEVGYMDAARRYTGFFLQDSGFRAALRGKEAFRDWWFTAGGQQQSTIMRVGKAGVQTWDEVYGGWAAVIDDVLLKGAKKEGVLGEVREAWLTTAKRIDDAGGQVVAELPDMIYSTLGDVRGLRRQVPHKFGPTSITETFMDKFFMDPTNSRRAFQGQLAIKYEKARLEKLFASQNKRVVSYEELAHQLGFRSGQGLHDTLGPILDDVAQQYGMVTEGYIARLAEAHAAREIRDGMYTWDRGSRAGQQMKSVVPFAGPWADMHAHWARQMMTKPHLRGWVNKENMLGDAARAVVDKLPFNPRPAAMVSRMAATDFTIDEGWVGEGGGLLPGTTKSDVSPLFFLPTGGDQGIATLIPGTGWVPTFLADIIVTNMHDPVQEPAEYMELIDKISQFIPGMAFTTGRTTADLIGGGTSGTAIGLFADLFAAGGHGFYELTHYTGDIGREIDRTRQLSSILSDPEELEILLSVEDEEELDLLLLELALRADQQASGEHALNKGMRWLAPVSHRFDTALDTIQEVWVEAHKRWPHLNVRPEFQDIEDADPEAVRRFANDVRKSFFDLPQWERDLMVAEYPQLAVNLVSSWSWTKKAHNDLGREAQVPYRTNATGDGLAMHQMYIEQGMIQPTNPSTRAYHILGLMHDSKQKTAKRIYTSTVETINDVIWATQVENNPGRLAFLTTLAEGEFGDAFGTRDPRLLWQRWGSYGEKVGEFLMEKGLSAESVKGVTNVIPTEARAWGTVFPGIDDSNLTEKFANFPMVVFTEDVQRMAAGVGIELTPGMTGAQLFRGIQNVLSEADSLVWSFAKGPYKDYANARSGASSAVPAEIREVAFGQGVSDEWRSNALQFLDFTDNILEVARERGGGLTFEEKMEGRERYLKLMHTSDGINIAWKTNWDALYRRSFGELEWEAPKPPEFTPPSTRMEAITDNNAYAPYIRRIVDGDTIDVSESRGPRPLNPFANVEPGQTKQKTIRIIGLRAREYGNDPDGAQEDTIALMQAIRNGIADGKRIYLVRDPDNFGNVDHYGRELAWLFIGDKPYYFEDAFHPTDGK